MCILRENRIIIAKSIWRSRLFVSVFTGCRRLSNVPLTRTQPTVVTRCIVYSRNNQHCLCAPLHIQVYNAVYTGPCQCTFLMQATIHPFPTSENSQDAITKLFSSVKTGYAESIVTDTLPFGINWLMGLMRSGTSISVYFIRDFLLLSLRKMFDTVDSIRSYCIAEQSISLTRRDNGYMINL